MPGEKVTFRRVPLPQAAPPHLSGYLSRDPALGPLYEHFPLPESWKKLEPSRPRPVSRETARAMERLSADAMADEKALFVLAGQQPGVLLGPALALYKLLSLTALAHSVEKETGRTVIPLFWIASHDSDRDEVASVVIPGREGEPSTHTFPFPERPQRFQVGELPVSPPEWRSFLEAIGKELPDTGYAAPLLHELESLREEEVSLTEHFARLCRFFLPAPPVFFYDGRDAEVEETGRALMAGVVRRAAKAGDALREGAALLEKAGFRAPLPPREDRLPLFLVENSVRIPLSRDGERVRPEGGDPVDAARLAGGIEDGSIRATPSAALRPIVQDGIFPNAATVVGQSELLYHAQLGPLYDLLGVRRPLLVPRCSFFLLPGYAEKRLAKIGMAAEDLLGEEGGSPSAKELAPHADTFSDSVEEAVARFFERIDRSAPGAVAAADPLRTKVQREAAKTKDRALKMADRAGENRRNLVHRLRQELMPGGKAQELATSPLFFFARYGPAWIDALREEIHVGDGAPYLLYVGGGGEA